MYYILDENNKPVASTIAGYHEWPGYYNSNVGKTKINKEELVSTVFLGLDHSYGDSKEPTLWETMIFGGEHDQYQRRYTSYDDAVIGHEMVVNMVRGIVEDDSTKINRLTNEVLKLIKCNTK